MTTVLFVFTAYINTANCGNSGCVFRRTIDFKGVKNEKYHNNKTI
jgi:hypothetical protein